MSVPSSKTTVTAERPNRDTERISSTRGRPLIAVSTGKVMNCSTSSGPRPGPSVSTCTWTLVTSGTASIGSWPSDRTPSATRSTTSTRTSSRLSSDQAIARSRSPGPARSSPSSERFLPRRSARPRGSGQWAWPCPSSPLASSLFRVNAPSTTTRSPGSSPESRGPARRGGARSDRPRPRTGPAPPRRTPTAYPRPPGPPRPGARARSRRRARRATAGLGEHVRLQPVAAFGTTTRTSRSGCRDRASRRSGRRCR